MGLVLVGTLLPRSEAVSARAQALNETARGKNERQRGKCAKHGQKSPCPGGASSHQQNTSPVAPLRAQAAPAGTGGVLALVSVPEAAPGAKSPCRELCPGLTPLLAPLAKRELQLLGANTGGPSVLMEEDVGKGLPRAIPCEGMAGLVPGVSEVMGSCR